MALCCCFLLLFCTFEPGLEALTGDETTLDISLGTIVISASGAAGGGLAAAETELNPSGYNIIQSVPGTTSNSITVDSGVSVVVTLSGVNINSTGSAFKIADNSTGNVTIIIADGTENYLQSDIIYAGIVKNGGESTGNLIISGGTLGTGVLSARGGNIGSEMMGGAGIGGAAGWGASNITIQGAIVRAVGGTWAAGIGCGVYGTGTNISIIDSTVSAIAGTDGAGIGGGYYAPYGTVIISGSSVYVEASLGGNDIGGGKPIIAVTPTSDGTTHVYRTEVTLSEVIQPVTAVKAVSNFQVEGLGEPYTDKTLYTNGSGVLYLWLPLGTTVKSLVSGGDTYAGSVASETAGVLKNTTSVRLNLGDGLISIYPDRFIQNSVTYPFSGKYEIYGSRTADTPLRINNNTDTPVEYDITLDGATIIGATWCSAVRIDNTAPNQSGNPENLIVNLTVKGNVFINGYNHPGLQADRKATVNFTGTAGSIFYCSQWYHNAAVSSHLSVNLGESCALVQVAGQPAELTAAYTQKPLRITFYGEHTAGDWIVDAEATCTAAGSMHQDCTVCGKTILTEAIPALGHTPGDAETCTEAQVCTVCGETLAPALGHTPGDAATCTEAQVCTVCGEILTAAMGHTPGDAATCTEAQVCTVCGEILAAALGHTPGDAATCTEAQVCTVCGETLAAALGHTPGDAATCTEAQVCTVCGEVLAAAFGHDYENGVCTICGAADPAHIELPVTGETNRFALLSMILMTMATLLYAVKRRLRSTK
jgi:hypothetical protein